MTKIDISNNRSGGKSMTSISCPSMPGLPTPETAIDGHKGGASIHGDGDFVPMDPSRLLGDGRKLSTRYRIDDAHITVAPG